MCYLEEESSKKRSQANLFFVISHRITNIHITYYFKTYDVNYDCLGNRSNKTVSKHINNHEVFASICTPYSHFSGYHTQPLPSQSDETTYKV